MFGGEVVAPERNGPVPRGRRWRGGLVAAAAMLLAGWLAWSSRDPAAVTSAGGLDSQVRALAQACAGCHASQVAAWAGSQHAAACRAFDPSIDPPPPGAPVPAVAVLGVSPLRQFLLPMPGGRLQVHDPALDPGRGEWFSIFGADAPRPGEWGHWTGRGMNWNAQCGYCHTTGYRKGYDPAADVYRTTWEALGVACEPCHGEVAAHVASRGATPTATRDRGAVVDACAACHARREDLTGEFAAGEPFAGHFRALLADVPDLYHPDGRAADEVFEAGSLRLSRMGGAGVTCVDCHEPHSGALRRPVDDDALCLDCHAPPGRAGARLVDRVTHSHHPAESRGARCVECHMPAQVYMGRDVRRDHAFTSPDPRLASELGLSDACRDCHVGRTSEWAIAWSERWFGAAMQTSVRRRARALARARAVDRGASSELLAVLDGETNEAWRASLVGALAPFAEETAVQERLTAALAEPSADVRAAAIRGLARVPALRSRLLALREDPVRLVRLTAAWATRTTPVAGEARDELVRWLEINADQPAGAIRMSEAALVEGRTVDAVAWARKAVAWDPSTPSFHTLARALTAAGKLVEAREALRAAQSEPRSR